MIVHTIISINLFILLWHEKRRKQKLETLNI